MNHSPKKPSRNTSSSKQSPSKLYPSKTGTQETSTETSWGPVASWYDKHLEKEKDTYHAKVVHPNLIRLLGDVEGKKILDLACGQGIFSRTLSAHKAFVTGVDIGKELIALAEEKNKEVKGRIAYFTSPSHDLYMLKDSSLDIVICVLALQNIEKLRETFQEVSRVLKPQGRFLFVLNHPSFRNPTHTHWGYDTHEQKQYRRVEEYMSESTIKIDMTPGSKTKKQFTVSFHRPLQVYVKALAKFSFAITSLEEWISHKESEAGPKKKAEDTSRKEIPMFMCIEARKV